MRNRGRRRRGETSRERIRADSDAEARNGKQSTHVVASDDGSISFGN